MSIGTVRLNWAPREQQREEDALDSESEPGQRQARAVKVHWGGEAMLSQHHEAFIPSVYRHGGAAHARMKPATPTSQTHSGLPAALHSRPFLLSGAFLRSFHLVEAALLPRKQAHPTPSLQCSDLLPKDGWHTAGIDPSHMHCCPVEVLQQREDPLLSRVTLQ